MDFIDGKESPVLSFTPGRTYRFDQSDSSNASYPLRFYYDEAGNWVDVGAAGGYYDEAGNWIDAGAKLNDD